MSASEITTQKTQNLQKYFGEIYSISIGALNILLALILGAGGLWLIMLGGSWYYALAAIGLLLSGVFLLKRRLLGVGIYATTIPRTKYATRLTTDSIII